MGERSSTKTSKKWKVIVAVLAIGLVVSLIVNVLTLIEMRHSYDMLYQKYISLFLSPISNSPPISISKAISIALNYGKWNETSLKGMDLNATLYYVKIHIAPNEHGFEILYPVTEPMTNYNQVRIGDVTYQYVWVVSVQFAGRFSIPPPGYYIIDAVTGELIRFFLFNLRHHCASAYPPEGL